MKKIIVKNVGPFASLITAILFLIAGLIMLFCENYISLYLFYIILVICLVVRAITEFFVKKKEGNIKEALFRFGIYILSAILLTIFIQFFIGFINVILGIIALILGLLRILIAFHSRQMEAPGFGRNLFSAALCISFAILIFINPTKDGVNVILLVTGIYFLLYSLTGFLDFLTAVLKRDLKNDKLRRRTRFALPNFITAGLTNDLVNKYNKMIEEDPSLINLQEIKKGHEKDKVNFEVMIHTSKLLTKRFGHVDICIGDTVYSYGCYDSSSCMLGGLIADGTFVVTPKEPYLKNCITNQKKYVIGYGCVLSKEQLKAVHDRIDEIFADAELMDIDPKAVDKKEGGDGAVTIVKMGGKVYKVTKGPFKRYFAIASNCVQLADTIIGKAGLDALSKNSLKTPGAYYDLMESMFIRKNSLVVRKTAYLQVPKEEKKKVKKVTKKTTKTKNKK